MVDLVGDCPDCLVFIESQPGFAAACASVGIERDMDTREIAAAYIAAYHARGHRKALETP